MILLPKLTQIDAMGSETVNTSLLTPFKASNTPNTLQLTKLEPIWPYTTCHEVKSRLAERFRPGETQIARFEYPTSNRLLVFLPRFFFRRLSLSLEFFLTESGSEVRVLISTELLL